MEKFYIVEVGSTTSKAYLYDNGEVLNEGLVSIEFKKNYKINNSILETDKQKLFDYVNELKKKVSNVFVYGTSIFRSLSLDEQEEWIDQFLDITECSFEIVSADEENEYTVYGAVSDIDYNGKITVMIGGGGSTELAIVENKEIVKKYNYSFGAQDITDKYPDLSEDKVSTDFDLMLSETTKYIDSLNDSSDYLVLAGGDYLSFYQKTGFPMNDNTIYSDSKQPYMIDNVSMEEFDRKYFYEMSLNDIIEKHGEGAWWKNTRGMRICVTSIVHKLQVKQIIPTRIGMVYGIINKLIGKQ